MPGKSYNLLTMKVLLLLRRDGPKCLGILALVIGIGWMFGVLLPVVICLASVVVLVVVAFLVGAYLLSTGRLKSSNDLPERHLLNDTRHPTEWDALENQLIKVFMAKPDDGYTVVMMRFAVAINAVEADQPTLPPGMSMVVMRKMLYEYQRRIGSLSFERYDERTAMTGPEVLRRLAEDERPSFLAFCRSLDVPTNLAPAAVMKPDHPSTEEMTQLEIGPLHLRCRRALEICLDPEPVRRRGVVWQR